MLALSLRIAALSLLAVRPPVGKLPTTKPGTKVPTAKATKKAPKKPTATKTTSKTTTTANPGSASTTKAPPASNAVKKPKACADFLLAMPVVEVDPLDRHLLGDTEMAGHPVKIRPDARVYKMADRILLDVGVLMTESVRDSTSFRRDIYDIVAFDARDVSPDCQIVGFTVPRQDSFNTKSPSDFHDYRVYVNPRQRLISNARCRSDTKGKDFGKVGCDQVRFRPLKVRLAPAPKTCGAVTVTVPERNLSPFPNHTRGDTNIAGNPTNLELRSRLDITESRVRLVTEGKIEERKPDNTTFEIRDELEIFRAPPHCEVVSATPDEGLVEVVGAPNDKTPRKHIGEGILERATCTTERSGSDQGKLGCHVVTFREITIETRRR